MATNPQDRTLAQRLSWTFVLFGVLVAGAFVVTLIAFGVSWIWLTPQLEDSALRARAQSNAHAAMIDEETGLRGYIQTGDVRFLDAYTRGETELAQANAELALHPSSVPEIAAAMINTRLAEERWRERWGEPASNTRPGAIAPSMSEGKDLFDAYRRVQSPLAEALVQRSEVLSLRNQRMITARVALALGVFVAALILAMRQHRKLQDEIVAPVAALLNHIRLIRDGHLDATVDVGGPRDLAELAKGLNEMVGTLRAAREVAAERDDALRVHSVRLRQILDASREFSESLNLRYVVGSVRESTAALGGYQRVVVWLMDDEQRRLIDSEEDHSGAATGAGGRDGTQARGARRQVGADCFRGT